MFKFLRQVLFVIGPLRLEIYLPKEPCRKEEVQSVSDQVVS